MLRTLVRNNFWPSTLILLICCGCGPAAPKLYPVSGTVTLDGKPLAEGTVYFKNPMTGEVDTLPVKEGKFAGKALGGERRVEVAAYRSVQVGGQMGGEVKESIIAKRFNTESTLKEEVKTSGTNTYDFKVDSK